MITSKYNDNLMGIEVLCNKCGKIFAFASNPLTDDKFLISALDDWILRMVICFQGKCNCRK